MTIMLLDMTTAGKASQRRLLNSRHQLAPPNSGAAMAHYCCSVALAGCRAGRCRCHCTTGTKLTRGCVVVWLPGTAGALQESRQLCLAGARDCGSCCCVETGPTIKTLSLSEVGA